MIKCTIRYKRSKWREFRFCLAALLLMVGALGAFIWCITKPKPELPPAPPVVVNPPPTPTPVPPPDPTPTPTPVPTPTPTPTPTPPPPPVVNPPVQNKIELTAWCDHMPVWKEDPKRRHLVVKSPDGDIEINYVEVRYKGKLLEPTSTFRVQYNKMHVYGAFPEGMHDAELEVTVYYTVRAKHGIRFAKKAVYTCVVEYVS